MRQRTIAILFAFILLIGCGFSTQIPASKPSGLEQMLIVKSLQRAAAKLELGRYHGKRVYLELFSQLSNDRFIRAYLSTLLQKDGAEVVSDADKADLTLKMFASVVGIDHAESLVGLASSTLPVVDLTIPEIAFYKSVRDRGYTDLKIFAFDRRTGKFLSEESPQGIGKSKYNRYTLLILIKFTVTDVNSQAK